MKAWPHNALRHSYGSYWLAKHQDSAALALQMGNSPAMVFGHYRELLRPKDAEAYWQISPGSKEMPPASLPKSASRPRGGAGSE